MEDVLSQTNCQASLNILRGACSLRKTVASLKRPDTFAGEPCQVHAELKDKNGILYLYRNGILVIGSVFRDLLFLCEGILEMIIYAILSILALGLILWFYDEMNP